MREAAAALHTPSADIADLSDILGQAWGVTCGETVSQYLAWSEAAGIFIALADGVPRTRDEIRASTILSCEGADALVPILASVGVLQSTGSGGYVLSSLAREYLIRESPYYVGPGLYVACGKPLPQSYLETPASAPPPPSAPHPWSDALRLTVQHSRNFAPSVVAARSGEFDRVRHLIDVGGGSGVLAIPLALDRPDLRITLVELPRALDDVRQMLRAYGVDHRITLVAADVFRDPWTFGPCDGIFFGNVFHTTDDNGCALLARESFAALMPGGKIWLHEVLFNEGRDGPLLAALWNANMIVRASGARQRTASELIDVLRAARFDHPSVRPTAGRFSLVAATKPLGAAR